MQKLVVYDYTKNNLFNSSLVLSTTIYNNYINILDTNQFEVLCYTACKITTYLVHAFCANTVNSKRHYYFLSFKECMKLYELLEPVKPIPNEIIGLIHDIEKEFYKIRNYYKYKGGTLNGKNSCIRHK